MPQALDLAERNERFKAFLDQLKPEALPRLDEVVSLVRGAEGEAGLLKRLDDGTLNEAVNVLPPPAMEIARETRSIDTALKWTALAGSQLPKVVELEPLSAHLAGQPHEGHARPHHRPRRHARHPAADRHRRGRPRYSVRARRQGPEEPCPQPHRERARDAVALSDRPLRRSRASACCAPSLPIPR